MFVEGSALNALTKSQNLDDLGGVLAVVTAETKV